MKRVHLSSYPFWILAQMVGWFFWLMKTTVFPSFYDRCTPASASAFNLTGLKSAVEPKFLVNCVRYYYDDYGWAVAVLVFTFIHVSFQLAQLPIYYAIVDFYPANYRLSLPCQGVLCT